MQPTGGVYDTSNMGYLTENQKTSVPSLPLMGLCDIGKVTFLINKMGTTMPDLPLSQICLEYQMV